MENNIDKYDFLMKMSGSKNKDKYFSDYINKHKNKLTYNLIMGGNVSMNVIGMLDIEHLIDVLGMYTRDSLWYTPEMSDDISKKELEYSLGLDSFVTNFRPIITKIEMPKLADIKNERIIDDLYDIFTIQVEDDIEMNSKVYSNQLLGKLKKKKDAGSDIPNHYDIFGFSISESDTMKDILTFLNKQEINKLDLNTRVKINTLKQYISLLYRIIKVNVSEINLIHLLGLDEAIEEVGYMYGRAVDGFISPNSDLGVIHDQIIEKYSLTDHPDFEDMDMDEVLYQPIKLEVESVFTNYFSMGSGIYGHGSKSKDTK